MATWDMSDDQSPSLTWLEIGARFPAAGPMWDHEVAPTLGWDPFFLVRSDGLLVAVPMAGDPAGRRWPCCCVSWDGEHWVTHTERVRRLLSAA